MTRPSLFLLYRWIVFGTFIICNAIVCSVAVWNMSFAPTPGDNVGVDGYIIFMGASGLLFIFPIIFMDLAKRSAITSRVWFETTWLTIFLNVDLAGAIAVSATRPQAMCAEDTNSSQVCLSSIVLLVFCWLCSITLLSYLLLLAVSACIHHKRDEQVWRAGVRRFPWYKRMQNDPPIRNITHQRLSSFLPSFHGKTPSLLAPRPRRKTPPPVFLETGGISSRYKIEHYRVSELAEEPQCVPSIPNERIPGAAPPALPIATLYPQHMQSHLTIQSQAGIVDASIQQQQQQPDDFPAEHSRRPSSCPRNSEDGSLRVILPVVERRDDNPPLSSPARTSVSHSHWSHSAQSLSPTHSTPSRPLPPPSSTDHDTADYRRATMPPDQRTDVGFQRARTTSVPHLPPARVRPSGPRTRSSSSAAIHIHPPSAFSRPSENV